MVKVRTVFDDKMQKKAEKYVMKKIRFFVIMFAIFIILIGVAYALLKDYIMATVFFVVGVFLYPAVALINNYTQKNQAKSFNLTSSETVDEYVFTQNKVVLETKKGEKFHSLTTTDYSYFYKVIEEEDGFLFFTSKLQFHYVSKDGIYEGGVEELRKYISVNIGKERYKDIKRKQK